MANYYIFLAGSLGEGYSAWGPYESAESALDDNPTVDGEAMPLHNEYGSESNRVHLNPVIWFNVVAEQLRNNCKLGMPLDEVSGPFGTHTVYYDSDEFGYVFAEIEFFLPDCVEAVIESGNHSSLVALRFYLT